MMLKIFITLLLVAVIIKESVERADQHVQCDLHAKNESCPDGSCCVRDDFLFTDIYCKPLGVVNDSCGAHTSEFECHCMEGLQCASNIHGVHPSLFGKCTKIPEPITTGVTGSLDLGVTTDSMNESSTQYPSLVG